MVEASIKIHKITWPILLSNKEKCKNNKIHSYGSLFADIKDLPEEDHKIFLEQYKGIDIANGNTELLMLGKSLYL